MLNEIIQRNFTAEYRAYAETGLIEGVPIVFDTPTDIGGLFQETICRGAIAPEIIGPEADVRFFWNHELNKMAIGRTIIPISKFGGLELTPTENNVRMKNYPNRQRTDANDLYLAIEDGTINAMSFMFRVADERWEDLDTDYPRRFILRIDRVIEVSAVNFAAYTTTSINARHDGSSENDILALETARAKRAAELEKPAQNIKSANAEIQKIIMRYKR